jgi:hypothetical protein
MTTMVRRSTLRLAAAGMLAGVLAGGSVACGAPGGPAGGARTAASDAPVLSPARLLGLTEADLPPGFRLTEEIAPTLAAAGLDDPFGRLSAYSVTFTPAGEPARAHDVVSSINAYASARHAQVAFEAWQAAVPPVYHAVPLDIGLGSGESAAYVQGSACLLGFRARNVLASVRVDVVESAPESPTAAAARLARLVIRRIDAGVRR